jgi:CubicO group peptidase (beta-lactamase class C family)
MAEQDVPGLAVALVDRDEVLWTEGFGHLDGDGSARVTVDTIFSVQSMSKNFTAVAVMQAVEAGLLDLDAPITTYLPDFTVHSAFEDLPERKITLRMLLSHTAGFTHEAPIGNNYERDPGTFDEHVASISETWLRFPVGSGYAYSNLGIDLAGAILARVSGASFPAVLRDSLLGPLGMDRSTFDRDEIVAATDRAIGHASLAPDLPAYAGMTAAGGLDSSATDLATYLRFQLGDGSLDGVSVLDPALMDQMRTIPAPDAGAPAGYALGVVRYRWRVSRNAELFSHGGGGFGFLSDLWWSPPLGVGVAVLTNSSDHELQGGLALSILSDLVHEPGTVYEERLLALPEQPAAVDPDGGYIAPAGMADLVRGAGMTSRGDEAERWGRYAGTYRTWNFGVFDPTAPPARFFVKAGVPYFDADEEGGLVHHRLTEVEPGLFLTANGQTLDLRGTPPTWRNLDIVRVNGGPVALQWVLLAVAAVAAVAWLAGGLVADARWRRRDRTGPEEPASRRGWGRLAAAVGAATALLALVMVALVVAVPAGVEAGFLGWLEWPWPLRLALHIPLALLVADIGLAILTGAGWARRWWPAATGRRHLLLLAPSLAFVAQLAAWGVIGWGLT